MEVHEIEEWLLKNKSSFSIRAIENAVGCPPDTIRKFLSGQRKIPRKWHGAIAHIILSPAPSPASINVSFGTKSENNTRRERAFLALTPNERFLWFIQAFSQVPNPSIAPKSSDNFILIRQS